MTSQYALCSHLTYDQYMDAPGRPNNSFITNYLRIYNLETGELADTIRMKVHGEPMWQLIANHLHWHGYTREQFFCWWRADFEADGTLNDQPRQMQLMELPDYDFARFAGSRLEHIA